MQPGLQTYKCYTYFRVQLSRCLRFEGMSVNGSYGEDKAQICSLGLHFFPSGLRLKRHHRTMELNGYQPQRLFFLTFFSFFFYSLEYQKVPHVSASGQKISGVRQRKRNTISNGRERESFNWEEEMEREERKERRLGSLSTSVQRRLLIMGLRLMAGLQLLLMEQLKCGLTTCSRSHAKVPYNIDEKKKKSFERILQLQLRL